jgi:ATP-dependent exoDNAse (exonuclease V) beta subunit
MTMHKAKGLEFDTVILTGLARTPPRTDAPLLRWRGREEGLLIAPSRARGGEVEPLYAYLGRLAADEDDAELGRLLYVACTRAKTRLHLVAAPGVATDRTTQERTWKTPAKGSSLAKLWHAVQGMAGSLPDAAGQPPAPALTPPPLLRLRSGTRIAPPPEGLPNAAVAGARDDGHPPFDWAAETARRIGTVAHRLLSRLHGKSAMDEAGLAALAARARADLAGAGFLDRDLDEGVHKVVETVRRTLADPRGRWIFADTHEDPRSEWGLAGVDGDEIVHVVLDRTFVVDGERWIVDFKTGTHEGGDVEGFLASEAQRYRPQLERYGRLMHACEGRPVRLALYYPLIDGGFCEIGADVPARA